MDIPLISLTGLKKFYPSGDERSLVLNSINLDISRASMTVIRGISGSGKTTLLNILGGLDRADEGQVRVGDASLDSMDFKALTRFRAERVGFIFQFHNLIPTLTVKENVLTGLEPIRSVTPRDHVRAEEYLRKVGLHEHAEKFPSKLSGGQQQRVAIARALIKEPQLILADEPTGSLDEETGMRVFELLRQMQEEKQITVVIVTHNPGLGQHADHVYEMRSGNLHRADS
ncbi:MULTISPECIES: ABC transporter ATP-binding protein [unclassified Pseudomonas]|jgi:putative ABC transport system ATP-binding protein|uniref:ABC transporter ATP-binding protein n=1 Tax=unclassified Pseudomonas TaxID=196821 RepID=UPI00119C5090|nr:MULTISPECIES: ABC transporter ATP-binding protein [unclassified Pseudomonas]TWC15489.1 putative ABC transport system ATP-binding protein [Pseudomonas sp. SJZ075]TWC19091.1 putative ABC transport system ATP-binding protein [Pseudomonas sp. SJZ074]TWC30443.1 putative ABC transport system ATP-binding protein [Pseudomonas sp. SJZ078]TWC36893.1 putative ABC transport system ATP-binding protein [Pseudomonas sp. SJZ085]TWC53156.1 putative ABC transport system ATP-binding protein [Pseudomonas sp. S